MARLVSLVTAATLAAPGLASAHPGPHDTAETASLLHWLLAPDHGAMVLVMALVVLGLVAKLSARAAGRRR